MGKTKTYPGLGSLEAELRGRLEEELDAYAKPFGRDERLRIDPEPRVTAEQIVDAVLARRASSVPPPPPSYPQHISSLPPPPAVPAYVASWPPPAPSSYPHGVSLAPERAPTSSFPTYAAIVAVVVSFAVMFVTVSQRAVPNASAAEPAKAPAAAAAPPPATPIAPPSCVDPAPKATEDKPAAKPVETAKPAQVVARPATALARPRAAKAGEEPKVEPAAPAATVSVAPNMDQAAKTAQMLREQLGASLR